MSVVFTDPRFARRAWTYASMHGTSGIDRTVLEQMIGHDNPAAVRALVDRMILDRHLHASATGQVRAGRPLPKGPQVRARALPG